jgi:hypothetical protein
LAASRRDHGSQVLDARFQRLRLIERKGVGETGPAFVIKHDPRERGEQLHEASEARLFPEGIQVREPAKPQHQIMTAAADDLIPNIDIATTSVTRFRWH